jgi:protein-L-isoaspartate(D-aspartate) O-methyltransferase
VASRDRDGLPDAVQREELLQRIAQVVHDPRVIEALRAVPRERFIPEPFRRYAYEDDALPIGEGQTISQPSLVAMMTEALRLTGTEHVLEIGTGSGYQAAVLAHVAHDVVTVEVYETLREQAAAMLRSLGLLNVHVLPADLDRPGAPAYGPYDAIIVTAAAPAIPPSLVAQLRIGGRIVIPVGPREAQQLIVARRQPSGLRQESLGGVRFVPLQGSEGHSGNPPADTSGAAL